MESYNAFISQLALSFTKNTKRPAISWQNDQHLTYHKLWDDAHVLASDLVRKGSAPVGISIEKTSETYIAILACIIAKRPFVPIDFEWPIERVISIIKTCHCTTIIDQSHLLKKNFDPLLELNRKKESSQDFKQQGQREINEIAYILFTSGSTGTPKGVPVSYSNLWFYIEHQRKKFVLNNSDRVSHFFRLCFDLSMFDIFMTWLSGAVLCVPSASDLIFINQYVEKYSISVWFSVPSIANLLFGFGSDDRATTLRLALFCGEPLSVSTVEKFSQYAPHADIWNVYGPTELTISCSSFQIERKAEIMSQKGIVSIGTLHDDHSFVLLNSGTTSRYGQGELCVHGPQMFSGYLRGENHKNTSNAFILFNGNKYYKTGDLVEVDFSGNIFYLGRNDNQIKLNGYRIELEEIERTVERIETLTNCVVAKTNADGFEFLTAYVEAQSGRFDEQMILNFLSKMLPRYMLPRKVIRVSRMTRNSSGKIDRRIIRSEGINDI